MTARRERMHLINLKGAGDHQLISLNARRATQGSRHLAFGVCCHLNSFSLINTHGHAGEAIAGPIWIAIASYM